MKKRKKNDVNTEYQKTYYQARKDNGLCVRCAEEARPNRTLCQQCADERNAYHQRRYQRAQRALRRLAKQQA